MLRPRQELSGCITFAIALVAILAGACFFVWTFKDIGKKVEERNQRCAQFEKVLGEKSFSFQELPNMSYRSNGYFLKQGYSERVILAAYKDKDGNYILVILDSDNTYSALSRSAFKLEPEKPQPKSLEKQNR